VSSKIDKQAYKDAVTEFRKKYYKKEMEDCLKIAKQIRDNTKASSRDRNEAIKTIARMVGGLTPDRMGAKEPQPPIAPPGNTPLPDSVIENIKAILDEDEEI
jgi:hypothetical protein